MVLKATRWSWKRIAARMLLVPVLAGGTAGIAHAQLFKSAPGSSGAPQTRTTAGPVQTAMPAGDAKAILKEGRRALAEHRFNDAQNLARKAQDASAKWGLFEDTPNSLLKDIQSAVVKSQKAESEQLARNAKALYLKHASSEAERAANLDTALQMARRADSLHGSYSAWVFGDRPDKLAKEIEAARARLNVPAASTSVAGMHGDPAVRPAVGTRMQGSPSGVMPAGGVKPPITPAPLTPISANTKPAVSSAVMDARKTAAVKLMAEGKHFSEKGDFVTAHAKLAEAQKLHAAFAIDEMNPDFALQELSAHGVAAMKSLIQDAQGKIAKKEFAKAEAALNAASDIANTLELFTRPIDEAKTALRMASGGKFGVVVAAVPKPAAEEMIRLVPPDAGVAAVTPPPVKPKPKADPAGVAVVGIPMLPTLPNVSPPGVATLGNPPPSTVAAVGTPDPKTPNKFDKPLPSGGIPVEAFTAEATTPAQANPAAITGRRMLDQATIEFQRGDFELAATIAQKAYNLGGVQKEANGLLNQIDAEVFAKKQRNADRSFEAAVTASSKRDHGHALSVLVIIDPNLLTPEKRAKREVLIATCKAELDKAATKAEVPLTTASGLQKPDGVLQPLPGMATTPPAANPPGSASIGSPKAGPDHLANQADSMRKVTIQKLRNDGLKVQSDAQAAFGRGDTDVAIQMLIDYSNKVRASGLDNASVALLLKSIDNRLEMFKIMKGQADALSRLNRENKEGKELVASRGGAADEQRKTEVARLVRQYRDLTKKSDFVAAERVALQAKQLEPDDPAIGALAEMAKVQRRVQDSRKINSDKEKMVLEGLNGAEKEGPYVDTMDPLAFNIERQRMAGRRGRGDDAYLRSRTPKEFEIEQRLDRPITVEYNQTPLSEVIEDLRAKTHMPFSWDTASLENEQISTAKPITEKLGQVSARNALHLILDKAGLSFVIEYDTVRITTMKKAKGRLVTKVFSVVDLVTPIPNFALPDYANFEKMMNKGGGSGFYPSGGGLLPAHGALPGGVPAASNLGAPGTSPVGISGNLKFGAGGTLQNNPLAPSSSVVADSGTKHEQLMKLVTGMVRPFSWDSQGGPGRIEYFDIGSALVVNQTADVIREVQDLLEALRRLQDLAVAVEIRIISLSESWFERMGVDFSMNIKTNTTKFEPSLTSGQFRPEPFINDINNRGVVAGIQPSGLSTAPGVFTPDLDVPIRSTSFPYAIPGFGGYPNNPGADGGVSLGLAFLNDIQVYLFMEAAQGDRRANIMQAPKITLFNGQTATINVSDLQFFVTDVQVFSVNGQVVFIPQITPLPGPGGTAQSGNRLGLPGNVTIALQAVVSADRRFVRINLPITLSAQSGATVPLFPITTFITPVFEGGSQGVPIPFTQFIQQPAFTTINISTTVVCPDGGTVLLGGLKQLQEGRNEFGPPFLSKIPYLNRLFKNVGIGRDTSHIMIMVTPRIIINSEEEINQTEGGPLGSGGPGR